MFDNDVVDNPYLGVPSFANLDDVDAILAAKGALSMAAESAYTELLEETNPVLQQASHRFQELFQGLPVSCFCYDANGDIDEWNRECEKASGIPASVALQRRIWDVYCSTSDAEFMQGMVDAVFAGESVESVELEAIKPDGTTYPVLCNMFPLRGFDGQIIGGISANVNIAERKRAEDEIRRFSEQLEERVTFRTAELARANQALALEVRERTLYADLVRNMQIAVVVYQLADVTDPRSLRLIATNPTAAKCTGVAESEMVGKSIGETFPNLAMLKFPETVVDVIWTGRSVTIPDFEYFDDRIQAASFSVAIFPLPNFCAGVSFENISERKQNDRELKRMHEENAQLLAAISSILISVNAQDRIVSWNGVAELCIGIKAADAVGKRILEIGIEWEWDKIVLAIETCVRTRSAYRLDDIRYRPAEGKERFLGMTVNPVIGASGTVTGYLILGTDITERRVLESQLAQAHKLESIGQLAAGIAHEINTPIQYVGDNTRFLMDAFGDLGELIATVRSIIAGDEKDESLSSARERLSLAVKSADVAYLMEEAPRAISQSLEGVQRVANIVRAMKEFSHPGKEEKTGVDLNHALESTITVARNEWKYVADLETNFDPTLPLVPCLPGDLNQVFLNIIVNAAHSIADVVDDGTGRKGKITISTSHTADWAQIAIADTGTGIPTDVQDRVFDPFFTTKSVGKGTGQGLAISHNVITDKHGGSITFETTEGKGTTFYIRLPLSEVGALI